MDSFISPHMWQIFSFWTYLLMRFSPTAKLLFKGLHKISTFGMNSVYHSFFLVEIEILKEVEAITTLIENHPSAHDELISLWLPLYYCDAIPIYSNKVDSSLEFVLLQQFRRGQKRPFSSDLFKCYLLSLLPPNTKLHYEILVSEF